MRRTAASALVAVATSTAMIGLAGPSVAAAPTVPTNPLDPIVQVVQTAMNAVDDLLCEVLGNTLVCGG